MNNKSFENHKSRAWLSIMLLGGTIGLGVSIAMQVSTEMSTILIISSIVFIISAILMNFAVNVFNIKHLTIPGFFYLTYLFMIFFPSIFIFFEKTEYTRYNYLFSTESVLIMVPLGIIFANTIFKFKAEEIKTFFSKPIDESERSFHFKIIFISLFLLSLIIMYFYISEVQTIPLFYMLNHPGEYYYLAQLREESFKLLEGPIIYLFAWLRNLLYPFLILLSFGFYLITKKRIWGLFFLLSFLFGVLYASFSIAKAPVAAIFLMLLIFIYIFKAGNLSKKSILLFILLIFAFPISVTYMVSMGMGWGLPTIIRTIWTRLFMIPADVLYYYFEIFPGQVGYLYGSSIGKLSLITGQEFFDTANYVYRYMYPGRIESGFANAAFIGNMYADFGLTGVLLGSFFVGLVMQSVQISLLRKKKTILNLALYAFLIYSFWMLNSIPFTVLLLTNGVILALILPFVIKIAEDFLKHSIKSSRSFSLGNQKGE